MAAEYSSIWDSTPTSSQFSQLPDDDFLAFLARQFPKVVSHQPNQSDSDAHDASVNPQSILQHPPAGLTPPSDDSSPSPLSNSADPASRRQSQSAFSRPLDNAAHGDETPALKRKASDDDLEEGPSSKNKHTSDDSSGIKKGLPTKRKSTGSTQDESRLLKRKEQNRAAQRAFRERKEKHVKDLEDKVAALEVKNEKAQAENSNLRDILTHLQQENTALKQSQFTFAVPKAVHPNSSAPAPAPPPPSTASSSNIFHPPSSPFSFFSGSGSGDIDYDALTAFDPAVLEILDGSLSGDVTMHQQQSQQSDYSTSQFGQYALPPPNQWRTIANNPWLMSFADTPDTPSTTAAAATTASPVGMSGGSLDTFGFGGFPSTSSPANSSSWGSAPAPAPAHSPSTFGQPYMHANSGLEGLFPGNFLTGSANRQNSAGTMEFPPPAFMENGVPPLSLSPVSHANGTGKPITPSSPPTSMRRSNSSSSLTNNTTSSPPTSTSGCGDGTCGGAAEADCGGGGQKRLTREDIAKHIAASGESPFTASAGACPRPESGPGMALHKASDFTQGHIIACHGSRIPKTQESPDNVEVLQAWRSITSDPSFKDTDMNQLCSEFSKKARCDGTKVVLEPEGVQHIMEKLQKRKQAMHDLQVTQDQEHLQQLRRQFSGQL